MFSIYFGLHCGTYLLKVLHRATISVGRLHTTHLDANISLFDQLTDIVCCQACDLISIEQTEAVLVRCRTSKVVVYDSIGVPIIGTESISWLYSVFLQALRQALVGLDIVRTTPIIQGSWRICRCA